MRQLITAGIRARLPLSRITQLWQDFHQQRQAPASRGRDLFDLAGYQDPRRPYAQRIWVKIDPYPDGPVATMFLSDEY